jgi:hypothetical protein
MFQNTKNSINHECNSHNDEHVPATKNVRPWVIAIGRKVIQENRGLFERLEAYDRGVDTRDKRP